ncbi:MAG: Wzz/FepE/Etk N-terminal domain-containing protein [Eubacteriales bacterium]|nr:Wzz/FepE/Etk N-terminal domain-containing protein [Eubacteriales bacterium]
MENNNSQNDDLEIDLGKIFSLLWDRILIIIVTGVLFAAAAFLGSKFFITPQYQSQTKLYVLNRANDGTTTLTDIQISTQLTKDYQILVTSTPVMQQVIKNLKLDMTPSDLASTISVSTPSDTRVLQISVTNPDPYRAKEIVDELAKVSGERICSIMKIEQVNVIEEGSVAISPISSKTKKNTVMGGVAGIILACVVVIIKSLLDDTLKTTEDVEKYLELSTLSVIPLCDEMDDGRGKNRKKSGSKKKSKESSKKHGA